MITLTKLYFVLENDFRSTSHLLQRYFFFFFLKNEKPILKFALYLFLKLYTQTVEVILAVLNFLIVDI